MGKTRLRADHSEFLEIKTTYNEFIVWFPNEDINWKGVHVPFDDSRDDKPMLRPTYFAQKDEKEQPTAT